MPSCAHRIREPFARSSTCRLWLRRRFPWRMVHHASYMHHLCSNGPIAGHLPLSPAMGAGNAFTRPFFVAGQISPKRSQIDVLQSPTRPSNFGRNLGRFRAKWCEVRPSDKGARFYRPMHLQNEGRAMTLMQSAGMTGLNLGDQYVRLVFLCDDDLEAIERVSHFDLTGKARVRIAVAG